MNSKPFDVISEISLKCHFSILEYIRIYFNYLRFLNHNNIDLFVYAYFMKCLK